MVGLIGMGARFFLHAPNIHSGGGLTLFKALLQHIPNKACLIIDERLPITDEELSGFHIHRIKPTLWHRFEGERLLQRLTQTGDAVLCFGNLPPLFRLQAHVALFIQNRHLIEPKLMEGMSWKLHLRLHFERLWLRAFYGHADKVIVQTPSMQVLASKYASTEVLVASFSANPDISPSPFYTGNDDKVYDFIYVASGEPHKNHRNLIDAWVILSTQGFFPSLCLTVDVGKFSESFGYIEEKKNQYGLNIHNAGCLISDEVFNYYAKARALIFPSTLESFGLPLLEAQNAGLKVVASELDYVRDLLDPIESFDPHSPVSIARAVNRFVGYGEKKTPVLNAEEFLQKVIGRNHDV